MARLVHLTPSDDNKCSRCGWPALFLALQLTILYLFSTSVSVLRHEQPFVQLQQQQQSLLLTARGEVSVSAHATPALEPAVCGALHQSRTSALASLAALNASNHAEFSGLLDWRCDCTPPAACGDGDDSSSYLALIANHVGWFGHDNIGDDVMPVLYAATLARGLAAEFPHLDVSVESRECASKTGRPIPASTARKPIAPPCSLPKHFWVLGGGSVFEYLGELAHLPHAMAASHARGEPLYLFGTGFQTLTHTAFSNSRLFDATRAAFINASGSAAEPTSWAGLVWGGMRGVLSRDIASEALEGTGAVAPYLGDPAFFAGDVEHVYPPLSAAEQAALRLPPKYIVTTCDTIAVPALIKLMTPHVAAGYGVVALTIGAFGRRTGLMNDTFNAFIDALGTNTTPDGLPVLSTMWLHRMRTLPQLLHVLRRASFGLHCMLHGGIIQAATGAPVLVNFAPFKAQDAWMASGITGGTAIHFAWDRSTESEIGWKVRNLLVHRQGVVAKTAAFTAEVRARHDAAMRAFVRHLTRERYPHIGAALACAPAGTRVRVRSHLWYEGAMLEVLLDTPPSA